MNTNDITLEGNVVKERSKVLYKVIKRTFDIVVSIVGCIFLLPIIIIVKISYIISKDYNSIFYTQTRIGKNGKEFKLYKFRSMIPNADEVLFTLLKENKEMAKEYKINKKLKNKMGKLLRKSSLDELPQMINILKGNMSMIGNRPYLPREKEDMGEYYEDIIKTKPGLTGYWQTSGPKHRSFEERLKLEKYYSNNCNIKLDIKIFFKTFSAVTGGHGAGV